MRKRINHWPVEVVCAVSGASRRHWRQAVLPVSRLSSHHDDGRCWRLSTVGCLRQLHSHHQLYVRHFMSHAALPV